MKSGFFGVLFAVQGALLLACGGTNQAEIRPFALDEKKLADYRLVWSDEFEGGGRLADAQKWWYEEGASGWGNNELQNYIPAVKGADTCAFVENGVLTIKLQKAGDEVLSARMNTKESWKYGYFEGRLKLPKGRGTWPAFWMLPEKFESWPLDGEIDIMEQVGYDPNMVLATIHCAAYNHTLKTEKQGKKLIPTAQDEFHIYAVEWTEDFIKGYVDGVCYFEFFNDKAADKRTWPFDEPFYLKLNLAWGGNWGGAMGIDPEALPASYEIDYVRVFQK